jgi:hypothetical protein
MLLSYYFTGMHLYYTGAINLPVFEMNGLLGAGFLEKVLA